MSRFSRQFPFAAYFACCALFFAGVCVAQEEEPTPVAQPVPEKEAVPSISDLHVQGLRSLEKTDLMAASDAADKLLMHYENDPRAVRLAGDLFLRSGKIRSAAKQFERYIEMIPADKPDLWQYGIALALSERYDDGRKLFELHRAANPNDVENAAWHFLCVAKMANIDQAKKLVLPAPGDTRVPMNEIRRLLIDGNEQRVLDAVKQLTEGSSAHETATFYANLYLGLYADAVGNQTKAMRLMRDATTYKQVNYMADIARVYLSELEAKEKATPVAK